MTSVRISWFSTASASAASYSLLCAHGGQLGRLSIGCAVWVILLLSQLLQQRATLDIGVSQRKVQARLLEEAAQREG